MDNNYTKESWVVNRDVELEEEEIWGFDSWMVVHTSTYGYTENEISIRVAEDGTIKVRDGSYDNSIWIDSHQTYPLIDYLIASAAIKDEHKNNADNLIQLIHDITIDGDGKDPKELVEEICEMTRSYLFSMEL